MKNKITLLLASIAPILSFAADITFPAEGGDLASLETWGESITSLENWTTNRVYINKGGIYTASADVSFGGIYISKNDGSFVFDMTADAASSSDDTSRIINLTQQFSINGLSNNTLIKGGTWNFNSKNLRVSVGYNAGCNYQKSRR